MKEMKLERLGFALTKEHFDLNIDNSALYATNAEELFRAAMIGEKSSRSLFKPIYGVKDRIKLGTVVFDSVIQPGTCEYVATDSTLSQKTFEVCPISIMTEFCVNDVETSFMSDQIAKGSKDYSAPKFMSYLYDELAAEVAEELEYLTFRGDTGLTSSSYLRSCDGLELILSSTQSGVLHPATASSVDQTNVVDKLIEARDAVPKGVRGKDGTAYLVSTNVYDALHDAISDNMSSGTYFVPKIDLKFQGVEVIEAQGASDDVIILGELDKNLLFITDLGADTQAFNVVDFNTTTLVRKVGMRTDAKVKFDVLKPNEIYFHKP